MSGDSNVPRFEGPVKVPARLYEVKILPTFITFTFLMSIIDMSSGAGFTSYDTGVFNKWA